MGLPSPVGLGEPLASPVWGDNDATVGAGRNAQVDIAPVDAPVVAARLKDGLLGRAHGDELHAGNRLRQALPDHVLPGIIDDPLTRGIEVDADIDRWSENDQTLI